MTQAQIRELEETLTASLKSTTIEWAMNMQICDTLKANPSLARLALHRIDGRLRKDSPVSVHLALSLLEILVKNCGLDVCRAVDEGFAESLGLIVKKRDSWRYGLGRNLHKSMFADLLPGVAISEEGRQLWLQASQKVLEILQLCADAFLLQEGSLRPVFNLYKRLRQEGYQFPRSEHGVAAGLCLVQGAEESPAYLAGAVPPLSEAMPPAASGTSPSSCSRSSPDAMAAGGGVASPEPSAAATAAAALPSNLPSTSLGDANEAQAAAQALSAAATAAPVDIDLVREDLTTLLTWPPYQGEGSSSSSSAAGPSLAGDHQAREELVSRLRAAREHASLQVEQLAEEASAGLPADETRLCALLDLVEDISEGLLDMGEELELEATDSAVPPPPSAAPPSREQQEKNDLLLAQYLQKKWEQEDQEEMESLRRAAFGGYGHAAAERLLVPCRRCRATNQLRPGGTHWLCFQCGLQQEAPRTSSSSSSSSSSSFPPAAEVRHAPPPRVIQAPGGAQELMISGTGSADCIAAAAVNGSPKSRVPASQQSLSNNQALTQPLFEPGAGSSAGNALLGGHNQKRMDGSWQQWAKSMRSWAPGLEQSRSKKLGDGLGQNEVYAKLGGDEGSALLFGGDGELPRAPAKRLGRGGLLSSWRPGGKSSRGGRESEGRESLLERVQVDDDWELIRPASGAAYWHNSSSQVSQWEPPAHVSVHNH
eukprot:TRINITY_DN4520_c3_g1_i1.p1 TRINITY_DN4520_c3_g1~~TRINITY_DN4520_c3_g1_i1.p1  ORF type:complete len:710 (+),score=192.15 TRINITY_DN4520_c3_g1_i1:107-2236(+)